MPEAPRRIPASVQRPLLQGQHALAGLWFPAHWLDAAARQRQLVRAWRPGAAAWRFEQGDVLRYAEAVTHDCSELTGWPLCRSGGVLSSAALTPAELAALGAVDVCIVQGGAVLALQFAHGTLLEPARWLDLRGLELIEPYDCADTLPPAVLLAPADARPLREVLGGAVPPASAEQAAFVQAASQSRASGRSDTRPWYDPRGRGLNGDKLPLATAAVAVVVITGLGISGHGGWARLLQVLMLMLGLRWLLRNLSRHRPPPGPGLAGAPAASADHAAVPARRSARVLPQRWRAWLARLAVTSHVAHWLGHRQAAYLRRTLEMFDDGRLDEALRHAVPLGAGGDSLGQAFGTPTPRADLSVGAPGRAAAGIHLGDALEAHLRRVYRQAFEQLDRRGRIDEAVFVLAELLQAHQEALDYLEQHGRHAQAAELALLWDRPADVVVRLLCLAGDWRRAVAVARRDGAFATAVLQLETRWPDAARRLREEWGEAQVQRGDWLGAVDAVWPVAALRERAAAWLQQAESGGGVLGARALVQRARLLPHTLAECATQLSTLRDERSAWRERAAVADALFAAAAQGDASRDLAAVIAAPVLADHVQGFVSLSKARLQRLVTLSGDRLLQADLPSSGWPLARGPALSARSDILWCETPSAGVHAIHDATLAAGGRYLLALGEAGGMLLDAAGRQMARFAVPADALVMAHSGELALALARRDTVWRVSRLDLVTRQATELGLSEFDTFAETFDGIGWSVARDGRLQVLDTGHSLREVSWQVTGLPGAVRGLHCSAAAEQWVVGGELWRYMLPQRWLAERTDLAEATPNTLWRLLTERGVLNIEVDAMDDAVMRVRWQGRGGIGEIVLPATEPDELHAWADSDWLVLCHRLDERTLSWIRLAGGTVCAAVRWPGGAPLNVRPCKDGWLVFDHEGRLLHLDTSDGTQVRLAAR